jgi:hypothetical protein
MTVLLVVLGVVLGCLGGLHVERRAADRLSVETLARLCVVASVGIVGTLIAAAELDGPLVHYLSLAAAALAAAAIAIGFVVIAQGERP